MSLKHLAAVLVACSLLPPRPLIAQEKPKDRAVGVREHSRFEPLAGQSGHAGLFVGVNEFTEDTGLATLRFAVNDAVSLAHLFALEIKLIPADRTVLALSGSPQGAACQEQLDELRKAGVTVVSASRASILKQLVRVASMPADPSHMLVVALSSHGFEDKGVPYLMPADGMTTLLADTAVNLNSVEELLDKSRAGNRVLLLDACRDKPTVGGKGAAPAMSKAFQNALTRAAGQAVLASCDVGQVSFEDDDSGHGVFTFYLLKALRGDAAPDAQGLIRLSSVAAYVAREVEAWSNRHSRHAQQPWFKGRQAATQIPLALDPGRAAAAKAAIDKLKTLFADDRITAEQLAEGKRALIADDADPAAAMRRQVYQDLADGKLDPKYLSAALVSIAPRPVASNPPIEAPAVASEVHASRPRPAGAETVRPIGLSGASGELPHTLSLDCGSGMSLDLMLIPAGDFMMGSPESEKERMPNESPQHRVRIEQPFYMGKFEVTQGQWQAVMGNNRSKFKGESTLPVEMVSWDDCKEFCRKLSSRTGQTVRLPSEAEWEYACRAGTTAPFSFGATISTDQANYDGNYTYGNGRKGKYREKTTPVGSSSANAWGLYDMHGNVWEWCEDVCHDKYNGAPTSGSAWTSGGDQGIRVLRGGSWDFSPPYCRSACRHWFAPDLRDNDLGFRVVVSSGTP